MTESGYEDGLRALLRSILLIGTIGCFVYLCYRLAVCRDEEDKRDRARFSGTTRGGDVNSGDKRYIKKYIKVQPKSHQLEV